MKNALKFFFVLSVCQIFSVQAQVISSVKVTGSICNQLNTSSTVTPDGQALSVLFQDLQLHFPLTSSPRVLPQITDLVGSDVQGGNWVMVDYHYCVVELEIKEITRKIKGVTLSGDVRGLVSIPKGFKGSFKAAVDYDTGFSRPSKARMLMTKQYWMENDEDWSSNFDQKLNMAGSCNGSVKKILIKVLLGLSKDKKASGSALLTVDSIDHTMQGLEVDIETAPCK